VIPFSTFFVSFCFLLLIFIFYFALLLFVLCFFFFFFFFFFLFSVAVSGLNSLRCFLILMLCNFYVSDYVLEGSEGTPFAGLLAMLLIQYMIQKIVWLSC
jgi:hypothetical protein